MNKVILIGRLTADPEVRYTHTSTPTAVGRYTLAVDRTYKREGENTADFIRCIAFGKQGEFAEKYLHKGIKVAIEGRIQTGSYKDKDGKTVYTTDVIVERHEFTEPKAAQMQNDAQENTQERPQTDNDGFMNIPEGIEEELPFD